MASERSWWQSTYERGLTDLGLDINPKENKNLKALSDLLFSRSKSPGRAVRLTAELIDMPPEAWGDAIRGIEDSWEREAAGTTEKPKQKKRSK